MHTESAKLLTFTRWNPWETVRSMQKFKLTSNRLININQNKLLGQNEFFYLRSV